MSRLPNVLTLGAEEWRALDAALENLIELDSGARAAQLREIAREAPERAQMLADLLNAGRDAQCLDGRLLPALGFLAEQIPLAEGTRIGPWSLIRPIGRGGMSEVYLAERADGAFERQVALKLLWPGLVSDQAGRRVRQERQILASLSDPRIAGLVDGGVSEEGRPWLAMEYVDGMPITEFCRARALNLRARIELIIEVAEAIAAAHRQLVLHGDIKPANVLVSSAGKVKLLDFGIARLLSEPAQAGEYDTAWQALTPAFASPEQAQGQPLTAASDIFQLGRLLQRLCEGGFRHPRGLRAVDTIASKAVSPAPSERYRSAEAFADELRALLAHRPVLAVGNGWAYRARCLLRRRWLALGAGCVLLAVGAGVLHVQLAQSRLLAARNATNEAMLGFLEDMLRQGDPRHAGAAELLSSAALEQAAAELQDRLQAQPEARARLLNTLGRVHLARHELLLSAQRHAEAMRLARAHALPETLDAALQGLSTAGSWSGDYAQSEAHLRELLAIRREAYGEADGSVAETQLLLADLLHSRGEYAAALEFARTAEANGLRPIASGRVLGMILRDLGDFDSAHHLFDRSLRLEHARQPTRALHQVELLYHHALLMLHMGRLEDARSSLIESERVRTGMIGERWTGLVWSRHWKALLALAEGEVDDAATLLDRMLIDYETHLGEASHLLAFARSDRAYAALAQGDLALAERLFEAAALRLRTLQVSPHPRLAEPLLGRALIALARDDRNQALLLSVEAKRIRSELPAHTAGVLGWQANACAVASLVGADCVGPARPAALDGGLDEMRLRRALDGLCGLQPQPEAYAEACAKRAERM